MSFMKPVSRLRRVRRRRSRQRLLGIKKDSVLSSSALVLLPGMSAEQALLSSSTIFSSLEALQSQCSKHACYSQRWPSGLQRVSENHIVSDYVGHFHFLHCYSLSAIFQKKKLMLFHRCSAV